MRRGVPETRRWAVLYEVGPRRRLSTAGDGRGVAALPGLYYAQGTIPRKSARIRFGVCAGNLLICNRASARRRTAHAAVARRHRSQRCNSRRADIQLAAVPTTQARRNNSSATRQVQSLCGGDRASWARR